MLSREIFVRHFREIIWRYPDIGGQRIEPVRNLRKTGIVSAVKGTHIHIRPGHLQFT